VHRSEIFKHTLEVTLQAYFTNEIRANHGKKAANSFEFTASLSF